MRRLQPILITPGCALALALAAEAELPKELRFDDLSYRTAGLYRGGSGDFFHAEYFPAGQASTNAARSVDFFRQPLSTDRLDQLIELVLKTLDEWKPKGVLTVLEKSERHLVLKDLRFDGTLSGSPRFTIYIMELEGHTLLTSQFAFRPLPPFDSPEAFSKELTVKETNWLKDLQQASRAIHKSIAEEANKGAAAKR